MSLTEGSKVIQIHPTRRCNLRCLHCYSASGPEERDELSSTLLCAAITDAAAEGYTGVAFSGGEPVLYKALAEVLDHARACGMANTLTTNGMLLDERRLGILKGRVDLLAISLDGVPASHNKIRASKRAFSDMQSRLEGLRATGIPFGFIFTLTQYNLDELEWVAAFAVEQGAKLLQIHPLEELGRAEEFMPDQRPDETEAAYAYLESMRIRASFNGHIAVQLDLVDQESVTADPSLISAGPLPENTETCPFADLLPSLIVETDGTVVPLQHGFARKYVMGNLHQTSLRELMTRWRLDGLAEFHELCQRAFQASTAERELPFFNWYTLIGEMALEQR